MSEELKLKFLALGLLSASAIGGEACKDCPHNIPRMSAALLTGDGEALRDCAKLLFKDCELVPGGTKARIVELEAERDRLREALKEIAEFADSEYGKRIPAPSCVEFSTVKRYAEKALKGAGE
ncbi:hypothetical protein [Victivallis vadensis]|mgnify:CR=1 FL=1|uniref:hypothetical protein n=1 Tax=Victivallis vadensis TaxID=172901 RepID=UPI0023F79A6D|nr:hypothetical protein [Victivallis vadensis]